MFAINQYLSLHRLFLKRIIIEVGKLKDIQMKTVISFFISLFVLVATDFAQTVQPSADAIIKEASNIANKENKKVFIIFHASWCGWCHKMDTSMADPTIKKFFTDNYVIRHLDVLERDDKKDLENAGAMDYLSKWKGDKQGVPYWVILDKSGNLLADSKFRKPGDNVDGGSNVGCPSAENEVAFFISVLKKTSGLKDAQLKLIYDRFRKNDPNEEHKNIADPVLRINPFKNR